MVYIDTASLRYKVKKLVGHAIYVRGVGYYSSRKVTSISAECFQNNDDAISVFAAVYGSMPYDTELRFDTEKNIFSDFECSCPYSQDCKHAVALALCFIDEYVSCYDSYLASRIEPTVDDLCDWINDQNDVKQSRNTRKLLKRLTRITDSRSPVRLWRTVFQKFVLFLIF